MDVPPFHQAEHLARAAAHLQGFAVELAGERVERRHDVGDGAVAVHRRRAALRSARPCPRRSGLVSLTICSQKSTPTRLSWKMLWSNMYSAASPRLTIHSAMRGRSHAEGHVLRVAGAGGVVVAADAADAAGDEVGVARVLALHEDAVAAEDRRGAVALGDLAVGEVDLGVDAQAADDPGDRVPGHLDQLALVSVGSLCVGVVDGRHDVAPSVAGQ